MSLFDNLQDIIKNGYIFMPYTFYNVCKDKLNDSRHFSCEKHFNCYELIENESIHVKAC